MSVEKAGDICLKLHERMLREVSDEISSLFNAASFSKPGDIRNLLLEGLSEKIQALQSLVMAAKMSTYEWPEIDSKWLPYVDRLLEDLQRMKT